MKNQALHITQVAERLSMKRTYKLIVVLLIGLELATSPTNAFARPSGIAMPAPASLLPA